MALRLHPAGGLALVLAASLLVAGCTPDPGPTPPAPATAGTSGAPSASPSPSRAENAEERKQREAFEAAEKAYRANFAEVGRLAMKGGTDEPTDLLLSTSTGSYLALQMQSLRYLASERARASENGDLAWVRAGSYSSSELTLTGCEDYRDVRLIKKDGATIEPENSGARVAVQTITVVSSAGAWKLSEVKSEAVKQC